MKFVSFLHDGEVRAGVLDKDEIILLGGVGRHHAHTLSDLI
mgnify:CR=1 FL=1